MVSFLYIFNLCLFSTIILATRYCKENGVWDDEIVCQASELFQAILKNIEVKMTIINFIY